PQPASPRRWPRRAVRCRVRSGADPSRGHRRAHHRAVASAWRDASIPLSFGLRLARLSGSFRSGRRREILFLDPAGLDAGLHDQGLGFLLAEIGGAEDAGVLHGFTILALAPPDQVVRDAAGQVLDRLDAVLAERHEHLGRGTGNFLEGILDAEVLALGVELGLLLVQELARARLQLLRGFLVEAFDAGEFLLLDQEELLDRLESFRRQQLA